MIDAIVKQTDEYVLTIDMTMGVAYQGRALADSAIELRDLTSGSKLKDDLARVISHALHAIDALQDKAMAMTKQAKKVGTAVFQVNTSFRLISYVILNSS